MLPLAFFIFKRRRESLSFGKLNGNPASDTRGLIKMRWTQADQRGH